MMRPQDFFFSKQALMGFLCVILSACGGGGGGASTSGGGQKPDPVAVDLPIAYIKRPIPVDKNKNPVFPEQLKPSAFNPGGAVYIKDRATALATPVNITDTAFEKGALYDVKDLTVHPAGDRLLFSMHAPMIKDAKPKDQPTWNIWEYSLKTKKLRRIISSNIVAEEGDDISPHYLADGRIVFSSTRQSRSKAILLDDGKPQFPAQVEARNDSGFLLHTMKDDGSDIQQISFNQSHDLQPVPLQDGRILYTHWDASGTNRLSFYTINPDGTQVERHYGYFSMNQPPAAVQPPAVAQPNQRWFKPQQMLDGRIVAILKPEGALLGGDIVVIDTPHFYEDKLPIPAAGGKNATAQASISTLPINITVGTDQFSPHGRFSAITPLYDGTPRLLTSWSECRLIEPSNAKRLVPCTDQWLKTTGVKEAAPLYGIWIYNMLAQTQQPVVLAEEGVVFTEPVSLEPRTPPTFLQTKIDPELATEGVGLLNIRSVYDMDGSFTNYGFNGAPASIAAMAQATPDTRPARFVRIIKAVSIPDADTRDTLGDTTYGNLFKEFDNHFEILGYTPVEPDGSVSVKVPADVAFKLDILDNNGRRLGAPHGSWLQLRPGEVRTCNGCHDSKNTSAGHGRSDAELAAVNTGAVTSGAQFPNTIRFDKLGTPLAPNMGETMAELAARSTWCLNAGDPTSCAPFSSKSKGTNLRAPSVDLVFNDEWTDPSITPKTPSFAYRYNDLAEKPSDIHAPTSAACRDSDGWTSLCRIIINYEQHIQPLLERERPTGACIGCHKKTDANGNLQIPSGQLELARTKSAANKHMLSYTQLLEIRNKQILINKNVLTSDIPVCEFEVDTDDIPECIVTRDINGVPTCENVPDCPFKTDSITKAVALDSATGNPIPLTRTVGIAPPMNSGGARASVKFFNRFINGGPHQSYLNNSELKLISEWLDMQANYYNNPFDTVEPN